ncbi:unnamed protein product, partial [Gulo gulo]
AALAGGLQALPRALHAELAGHRRAMGHLHHLLRHHQRGGLHPALLGGRQREHPQAWLLRPLPLLCGQRAGGPRAHLPRLLHRLQHHPVRRLQGSRLLRAALHGADPRLYHLLCAFLLLQHGHGLQDLRLDAALGSSVPRAGLHDLPRRLGRRDDPGHVRGQDREVLPGGLFGALGVHPGHHRHPQRPHP